MGAIFISHSSKNNAEAQALAKLLREKKYHSLFLDFHPEDGIPSGRSWERTLYRSLRACEAVIALITDDYLASHWCFAEIALARMERKEIFALMLDPLTGQLPSILSEKQYIDMRPPASQQEGYRRLWNGLDKIGLTRVKGDWDEPYRGLSVFEEKHAPIFFGREELTQAGLRLVARGAPGFVMVLGASGSGKSSLVRAGMLPQIKLDTEQWIVLDPFQPGRDPFRELATSLQHAFRRHAPDAVGGTSWETTRRSLEQAGRAYLAEDSKAGGGDASSANDEDAAAAPDVARVAERATDQRVAALLEQLQTLSQSPPDAAGPEMRSFLEWSLGDLRRICDGELPSAGADSESRSGTTPLVDLAERLRRGSSETRYATVLVVVDQFEELLGPEASDQANAFLALLRRSIETEGAPLLVLGTMRTDFLAAFQRQPVLRDIEFESLPVGPMGPDGMRRVIERPAALANIELQDGLADLLLEHTETPDALPLLSFTLWKLWKDCGGDNKLDIKEYEDLGYLEGAIATEAEELLAGVAKNELPILRDAFVQMARTTDDGSFARKPVSWAELPEEARPILERFVEKRLLMTRGDDDVEVAHEALFRSWSKLKGWLHEHRSEIMLTEQLGRDAKQWKERAESQRDEVLWRGGRLEQAAELLEARTKRVRGAAKDDEEWGLLTEFVDAGLADRRRLRRRRVRITASVMAVLAVAAAYSFTQQLVAKAEQRRAEANLKAFKAGELLDKDHTRALWLARDAYELVESNPPAAVQRVLSDAFHKLHERKHFYRSELVPGGTVHSTVVSEDGAHALTASDDGKVRLWDRSQAGAFETFDARQHSAAPEDMVVYSAVFSADGKRVLAACSDGTAKLWDPRNDSVQQFPGEAMSPLAEAAEPREIDLALFQPKGARVLTACVGATGAYCKARSVTLWNEDGTSATLPAERPVPDAELLTAEFSPDGYILAAWRSGPAMLWSPQGEFLGEFPPDRGPNDDPVVLSAAHFSRDGHEILLASERGVEVWTRKGEPGGQAYDHPNAQWIEFSPDGASVLTGDPSGTVKIWNAAGDTTTLPIAELEGTGCADLAWGGWALTCPQEGELPTVKVWQDGLHVASLDHAGADIQLSSTRFSSDGREIITADINGSVRIWPIPEDMTALHLADERAFAASFAPAVFEGPGADGAILTTHADYARIWDPESGESTELRHEAAASAVLSHDGRHVVTRSHDGSLKLWIPGDGDKQILPFPDEEIFKLVRFSPVAPSLLLTVSSDGANLATKLWELPSGDEEPAPLAHQFPELPDRGFDRMAAEFSPGGTRVLVLNGDGGCRLWEAAGTAGDGDDCAGVEGVISGTFFDSERPVLLLADDAGLRLELPDVAGGTRSIRLKGEPEDVTSLAVTGDGRELHILTVASDGHVRLRSQAGELVADFDHGGETVHSATFSADGEQILSASEKGVKLWLTPRAVYESLVAAAPE
jgi:WD40 repeat protein